MNLLMRCMACSSMKPQIVTKPCDHSHTCLNCMQYQEKPKCARCRRNIVSIFIPETTETLTLRQTLGRLREEKQWALEQTIQIVFIGGSNRDKETLSNVLKQDFPCPPGLFNPGPFASGFEPNAFVDNCKVRFCVHTMQSILHGFIPSLINEKPNMVVICGSIFGESIHKEFQKWQNCLNRFFSDEFRICWIVLPSTEGRPPIGNSPDSLFLPPPTPNFEDRTPDGNRIFHYWTSSIVENARNIGYDLIRTLRRLKWWTMLSKYSHVLSTQQP